jgi:hypothetical protein
MNVIELLENPATSPEKSKQNCSQLPLPLWVAVPSLPSSGRPETASSSLNSIGTARADQTFILKAAPLLKSIGSSNTSVAPPKTSPANFCMRAVCAVAFKPDRSGLAMTVATPPANPASWPKS